MSTAPVAPPGRALAGWWRQLAPHQIRRLWFADWLVHCLDVLTRCSRPATLEPVQRLALGALALGSMTATRVAELLGVEPALAARMLAELADYGLAREQHGAWTCGEAGRTALERGEFLRIAYERRTFHLRHDPPTFLPLAGHGQPVAIPDTPPAPLAALREMAGRAALWKAQAGFPAEVQEILDLTSPVPPGIEPWLRVPVDRPERLTTALALTASGDLLSFACRADTWELLPQPILSVSATNPRDWHLPDPDLDSWRTAWRGWCRSIRVTPGEVDAAAVRRSEHKLIMSAPPALVDRLRVARTELLRGEAWLLAGDGASREAVVVELGQ
jgi:hypothetical protein